MLTPAEAGDWLELIAERRRVLEQPEFDKFKAALVRHYQELRWLPTVDQLASALRPIDRMHSGMVGRADSYARKAQEFYAELETAGIIRPLKESKHSGQPHLTERGFEELQKWGKAEAANHES